MVFTSEFEPEYGVSLDIDPEAIGDITGSYAGEIIQSEWNGEANVLVLGFPQVESSARVTAAMEAELLEIAPRARIRRAIGGTRENGRKSVEQAIENGEIPDVILSLTDATSYGAIEALEAADIPESSVAIISTLGEPLAQQYIREGHYIRATLELNRETGSQAAVNAMVKLLAGEPVPESILIPPGTLLTRETMD
jgi:ABC-type sugar transport system substrate-binding protein